MQRKVAKLHVAIISLVLILSALSAIAADNYPSRPIRIIVPLPAGGIGDAVVRKYAEMLTTALGQHVVVENKPGASNMIGTDFVAKAPPDGYTLLYGSTAPLATNVSLFSKISYDPIKDFAPIRRTGSAPMVVVVHPSLKVKTLQELIKFAKSKPDELVYASGGTGTTMHLAGEMLKTKAQINLVHVPYKGEAPSLQDLLAGHVPISVQFPGIVAPYVAEAKLIPLVITSRQRSTVLPDVPSASEVGFPDLDLVPWGGFLAPASTPNAIVRRLNEELGKIQKSADMIEFYKKIGGEIAPDNTPEEFAEFMKAEIVKWGKLVKASGAKLD